MKSAGYPTSEDPASEWPIYLSNADVLQGALLFRESRKGHRTAIGGRASFGKKRVAGGELVQEPLRRIEARREDQLNRFVGRGRRVERVVQIAPVEATGTGAGRRLELGPVRSYRQPGDGRIG